MITYQPRTDLARDLVAAEQHATSAPYRHTSVSTSALICDGDDKGRREPTNPANPATR